MAGQIERIGVFTSAGPNVEIAPQQFPAGTIGKLKLALGYARQMSIYSSAAGTLEALAFDNDTTWYTVPGVTLVAGSVVSFTPPAASRMRIVAASGTFTVDCQYDMAT